MKLTSLLSIFADEAMNNCISTAIFGQVCDNCNGSAVMQILAYVVRIMTIGVGILAVIGIMVFGIRYLTSHGNENLAIKARRHLFQVLLGLVSYIVLVLAAGWILPGNLTTTMLGGNPGTCPESTKTGISVIGGDTDPTSPSSPSTDPSSPSSGWKSGTRPRECGPGEPGDFQTMTKKGVTINNRKYSLYTNSAGRTYPQYSQGNGPWAGKPTRKGGTTIAAAGCMIASRAMMNMSYSSGKIYVPTTGGDNVVDKNINHKAGHSDCNNNSDCPFNKIKKVIDSGGSILVHITGPIGRSFCTKGYNNQCTHYFLIVDYRIKDGQPQYFALNTGDDSNKKWYGCSGTGWGKFGYRNSKYTLYYHYPKIELDCKVR